MKKRGIAVTVLWTAMALVWPSSINAFDTGHHRDMTWTALEKEGFSQDAIKVVVLQNWLIDYYAAYSEIFPKFDEDGQLTNRVVLTQDLLYQDVAALLHFDNLRSATAIEGYWRRMTFNTYCAVHALLSERQPDTDVLKRCPQRGRNRSQNVIAVLTLLGVSLHAVQDFYTHSTWVELQQATNPRPTGVFSVETWFDRLRAGGLGPRFANLRTGRYGPGVPVDGNHHDNVSNDNYERPNWDRAYVFGYAGTRQWVNQFRLWVEEARPGFWADCILQFVADPGVKAELTEDLLMSFESSSVVGKWKGMASAAESERLKKIQAATVTARFAQGTSTFRREFTEAFIFMKVVPDTSFDRMNNPRFDHIPKIDVAPLDLATQEVPVLVNLGVLGRMPDEGYLFARMRVGTSTDAAAGGCAHGTLGGAIQCFDENLLVRQTPPPWKVIWFQRRTAPQLRVRLAPWLRRRVDSHLAIFSLLGRVDEEGDITVNTTTGECSDSTGTKSCTADEPLKLPTASRRDVTALTVSVTIGSLVR